MQKAQTAMEYLLIYGWVFVLVASAFGLVNLVSGGVGDGVHCRSSNPAKISVKGSSITSQAAGNEIILTNLSGGKIEIVGVSIEEGTYLVERKEGIGGLTVNNRPKSSVTTSEALKIDPSKDISIKNFVLDSSKPMPGKITILYYGSQPAALRQIDSVDVTCTGKPAV